MVATLFGPQLTGDPVFGLSSHTVTAVPSRHHLIAPMADVALFKSLTSQANVPPVEAHDRLATGPHHALCRNLLGVPGQTPCTRPAVLWSSIQFRKACGVQAGAGCRYCAMTPAACGAAIDVP